MFRGKITLWATIFLSILSGSTFADLHSAYPGGSNSFSNQRYHHRPHGKTNGGRYYGMGNTGGMYPNSEFSTIPCSLGSSYFPTSNYYSPTSGNPGYSFGYWSPQFGNWGMGYKQPCLYNNYQFGPYNYGYSPSYGSMPGYGYSPCNTWPGSSQSYGYPSYGYPSYGYPSYGLGVTYNPCNKPYGFFASNPGQPRILGVSF